MNAPRDYPVLYTINIPRELGHTLERNHSIFLTEVDYNILVLYSATKIITRIFLQKHYYFVLLIQNNS